MLVYGRIAERVHGRFEQAIRTVLKAQTERDDRLRGGSLR